jgi:hypothetical protein
MITKPERSETEAIDLSAPVPQGYRRIAFDLNQLGPAQGHYPTGLKLDQVSTPHDTWIVSGTTSLPDTETSSFADLLASLSFASAATMRNLTASACVQWMNLFGPEKSTRSISPAAYTQLAFRFSTISVSPSLRMKRNLLPKTVFFAPSGAQLTWAELVSESDNGGQ